MATIQSSNWQGIASLIVALPLDNCGIFKQLYNLSWQLLQIVAHTLYVIYEAWNCLLNLLH